MGKLAQFTAEQLMTMLLVDLKEIAEGEGSPVTECVLAVPTYYTEPERHAMLAAAQVRKGTVVLCGTSVTFEQDGVCCGVGRDRVAAFRC